MQKGLSKRLFLSLSLSSAAASGMALATVEAVKAQPQSSDYESVSSYCDSVSRDIAEREFSGDRIIGRAAEGATGGFVLGSVFGGEGGRGALVGAMLGSLGGLGEESENRDRTRRAEYDRCMSRNGF
ncbi:MAG: hypothetical protein AAFQ63_19675 [Cyanobacteria bacterium J06621_11]